MAPTLFLWGQLTVVKLLGFSEYTLRLVPLVCSIASLFLFRRLAGLLLRGTALLAAFGIFAVAYPPIRYTAEAKPYGCDLFLALLMLCAVGPAGCAVRARTGWLWGLAALIAPAVGFSYPASLRRRRRQPHRRLRPLDRLPGCPIAATGTAPGSRCFPGSFNSWLVASFLRLLVVSRTAVGESNQKLMERLLAATPSRR